MIACPPRDVVVGARRVAAHAESRRQPAARVVERQPAAKHVDAADSSADHRIVGLSVVGRIAAVRDASVHRIALLQPEQAAAGLHRAIEVGGREREMRQAERVGGVRLLRGDDAAARPLIAAVVARERDGTDDRRRD